MTRIGVHQGLYNLDEETPSLIATQCERCETVFFPPLQTGCEVCGSDKLVAATIPTNGTIYSTATVHRYAGDDVEAPFTIAEVSLDAGPLIRVTLREVIESDVIGKRTKAEWESLGKDEDGNSVVEPRFSIISDNS